MRNIRHSPRVRSDNDGPCVAIPGSARWRNWRGSRKPSKKHVGHGHALDVDAIKKELGDVLWYVAGIATALGLDLSEVASANINKLKRCPDGLTSAASVARVDEVTLSRRLHRSHAAAAAASQGALPMACESAAVVVSSWHEGEPTIEAEERLGVRLQGGQNRGAVFPRIDKADALVLLFGSPTGSTGSFVELGYALGRRADCRDLSGPLSTADDLAARSPCEVPVARPRIAWLRWRRAARSIRTAWGDTVNAIDHPPHYTSHSKRNRVHPES